MNDNPTSSQGETDSKNGSLISRIRNRISDIISPGTRGIKETIEEILDIEGPSSTLAEGEKKIIRNILEFKELYVEDVMVPRSDVFAVPDDIDVEELEKKIVEKGYTRVPVYKGDLDEIVGFIHIKDIAKAKVSNQKLVIKEIIRKCLFVPGPMKISNLLIRMQQSHVHIAIVVDEYGGTEGLITLEDIIEEIVGRIEDEHDAVSESQVRKISDNEYEVNPRTSIEDFLAVSHIDLTNQYDKEEYDTIGGLVYLTAGRIPVKGEIIRINENIEIEIVEADARTIRKALIRKRNSNSKEAILI